MSNTTINVNVTIPDDAVTATTDAGLAAGWWVLIITILVIGIVGGLLALGCQKCCENRKLIAAASGAFGTGQQTLERRPRRKEKEFEKYIQENI
jgi:NAD/NADP transhydrogenase beta subunit